LRRALASAAPVSGAVLSSIFNVYSLSLPLRVGCVAIVASCRPATCARAKRGRRRLPPSRRVVRGSIIAPREHLTRKWGLGAINQ
jgi:hypothetical protein